jgi:hypothetical protein
MILLSGSTALNAKPRTTPPVQCYQGLYSVFGNEK